MNVQEENPEISEKRDHVLSEAKPWTRYLVEFILLFLAVSLGFMADNYRERISEEQQAKELAQSFYDELLADSVVVHTILIRRYQKDTALVKFKNYVLDSSLQKPSKRYVMGFYGGIMINARFSPKDVILEQLKNSGALRYFRSKEIQHLVGVLSVAISNVRTGNDFELQFTHDQLMPFIIRHNDQRFFDELTQNGSVTLLEGLKNYDADKMNTSYHVSNLSEFNRESVSNFLGMYRHAHSGTTGGFYVSYIDANKKLLAALRREYQISNELLQNSF
jgi:hypothetical protein